MCPPTMSSNVLQAMEQAMNQGKQGGAVPGANPFAGMNGGGGMPPGFGFPPMPPSGFSTPPNGGQTVDTTAKAVGELLCPPQHPFSPQTHAMPLCNAHQSFQKLCALFVSFTYRPRSDSRMFQGPCKTGIL